VCGNSGSLPPQKQPNRLAQIAKAEMAMTLREIPAAVHRAGAFAFLECSPLRSSDGHDPYVSGMSKPSSHIAHNWRSSVYKAPEKMTFKVPPDVRQLLASWAADNVSNMNAEVIRAIREKAEREREKAVG
jgi:hypothetical protein